MAFQKPPVEQNEILEDLERVFKISQPRLRSGKTPLIVVCNSSVNIVFNRAHDGRESSNLLVNAGGRQLVGSLPGDRIELLLGNFLRQV